MLKTSELIYGNSVYKNTYVKEKQEKFIDLAENGQKPQALFIGCADSRVVPNLITQTDPGDMFVMRNVGNFVPKYGHETDLGGVSSAIEYSVQALNVSEIIVCGHTQCGAIAALYSGVDKQKFTSVNRWLQHGRKAQTMAVKTVGKKAGHEALLRATEKFSVMTQMENLLSYPFVKERVEAGTLQIHGWIYDIKSGEVEYYDEVQDRFVEIDDTLELSA